MEITKTIDYFGNTVYVPNTPQIDIQSLLAELYTYRELESLCGAKYGVTVAQLVAGAPQFTILETEEREVDD